MFQSITKFLRPSVVGCYYSRRPRFHGGFDEGWLRITQPNPTVINFEAFDLYSDKEINTFVLSNNDTQSKDKTFYRWDGSLVNEGESKGLFGGTQKNAQIFTWVGDILIRRVYKNYWFRGPFGGYWGAREKDRHYWRRVECDDDKTK